MIGLLKTITMKMRRVLQLFSSELLVFVKFRGIATALIALEALKIASILTRINTSGYTVGAR